VADIKEKKRAKNCRKGFARRSTDNFFFLSLFWQNALYPLTLFFVEFHAVFRRILNNAQTRP
jgi:hypothetical protein